LTPAIAAGFRTLTLILRLMSCVFERLPTGTYKQKSTQPMT
jgi:hypothetical protein